MSVDRDEAVEAAIQRLLNKRRLGSFYLDDVKLLAEQARAADIRAELPGTIEFLQEYADKLDLRGYPVHAQEIRKLVAWSLARREARDGGDA